MHAVQPGPQAQQGLRVRAWKDMDANEGDPRSPGSSTVDGHSRNLFWRVRSSGTSPTLSWSGRTAPVLTEQPDGSSIRPWVEGHAVQQMEQNTVSQGVQDESRSQDRSESRRSTSRVVPPLDFRAHRSPSSEGVTSWALSTAAHDLQEEYNILLQRNVAHESGQVFHCRLSPFEAHAEPARRQKIPPNSQSPLIQALPTTPCAREEGLITRPSAKRVAHTLFWPNGNGYVGVSAQAQDDHNGSPASRLMRDTEEKYRFDAAVDEKASRSRMPAR